MKKVFPTDLDIPVCSDEAGGVSPAERLSPEHLLLLRNALTRSGTQAHPNGPNRRRARRRRGDGERGVHFAEFREVLRSVIGPEIEDEWIERFFNEVSQIRDDRQ